MDSVTQFALGACVGVAVLGRRIGPRRAAITGGILGTLPDLDVFLAPDDPINSFVEHRGWTHSLFAHAALTPLIGELVRLVHKPLRDARWLAWAAVFLSLTTHALLDALTIYGTRIFWPLSNEPISIGAVFIIDPLYTLPLLVAMIWAFFLTSWTARFTRVLTLGLTLSTVYLGWALIAQRTVHAKAVEVLADKGIKPDGLIATPTPFNTVFWRAIVIDGNRSFNLYMPALGNREQATLYMYGRNADLERCLAGDERINKVARFSHGFYRLMVDGNQVSVADLRMGLTPNYAFRFEIARLEDGKPASVPTRRVGGRGDIKQDLNWLVANMRGNPVTRPAEAGAIVDLSIETALPEVNTLKTHHSSQ